MIAPQAMPHRALQPYWLADPISATTHSDSPWLMLGPGVCRRKPAELRKRSVSLRSELPLAERQHASCRLQGRELIRESCSRVPTKLDSALGPALNAPCSGRDSTCYILSLPDAQFMEQRASCMLCFHRNCYAMSNPPNSAPASRLVRDLVVPTLAQ